MLGALDEVAAAHRATPAQVALAWLIARPIDHRTDRQRDQRRAGARAGGRDTFDPLICRDRAVESGERGGTRLIGVEDGVGDLIRLAHPSPLPQAGEGEMRVNLESLAT